MTEEKTAAAAFLEQKDTGGGQVRVAAAIKNLQAAMTAQSELEEKLKVAKKLVRKWELEEIPQLMKELGFSKIEIESTGETVEVKEEYYCSIPKKNKSDCADWLIANDLGPLVQNEISLTFGPDAQEDFEFVKEVLGNYDLNIQVSMNTSQIKAALKEKIKIASVTEGAEPVPTKMFGLHIEELAKVKKSK